ncbi:hypothetical protein [Leisingera daeponensis]|uniref:hypothetical protein n=1 Tax=Leisingera daeponensis TaxID=405746 RepID=UPI001C93A68E|nr:hypothetical protein [Leisingera daeponensis]MBY6058141.1 hypothetical protein [Leisingera daeponensis]
MISSVSSSASLYSSLNLAAAASRKAAAVGEAGGQPVDAPLTDGTSQGLSRSLARAEALNGAVSQPQTSQHIGPARAAARAEALEQRPVKGLDMDAYYQDLMNGCQAGPKPVSVLAAEAGYIKAQKIIG